MLLDWLFYSLQAVKPYFHYYTKLNFEKHVLLVCNRSRLQAAAYNKRRDETKEFS